jgi:hypothetical protein
MITHGQTREEYEDIYRQIDGEKLVTEPRPAVQLDLDRVSPLVAASERQMVQPLERLPHPQEVRRQHGGCRSGGGNMQDPAACNYRVSA